MDQGAPQKLRFLELVAETLFQPAKVRHPSTEARYKGLLMRLLRPGLDSASVLSWLRSVMTICMDCHPPTRPRVGVGQGRSSYQTGFASAREQFPARAFPGLRIL